MTETRTFHIGDILSAMTGVLVAPDGVGAMYQILGYLTGEPGLMTHQLPRASREAEEPLRRQFPDLAQIVIPNPWPEGDPETVVLGWLAEQVDRYGATREVTPLAVEDHTPIDPITELRMMRPDMPIIGVVAGPGDAGNAGSQQGERS